MGEKKMVYARKARTKKADIQYGYNSKFPSALRELLEETSTTQDMLAAYCNVARQSVAQWKDGKTKPDIYYLELIAEYFQVPTDYLLGRSYNTSRDDFIQEICKRFGLSERSLEWLEYCKDISGKLDEYEKDADVAHAKKVRRALKMLNLLLSARKDQILVAHKHNADHNDFGTYGNFFNNIEYPLIAIEILATLYDYCHAEFEASKELFGTIFEEDLSPGIFGKIFEKDTIEEFGILINEHDIRQVKALRLSTMIENLRRWIRTKYKRVSWGGAT